MTTHQPASPRSNPAPKRRPSNTSPVRPAPARRESARQARPTQPPIRDNLATMILRVGLVAHGILCWNAALQLYEGGDTVRQRVAIFLSLALSLFGFLLLILATRRHLVRHYVWLILPVIILIFFESLLLTGINQENAGVSAGSTDVLLFSDQAARLLRMGENPYESELSISLQLRRMTAMYTTPLLDGDITGRAAYPALSILLFVPAQWLGISMHLIYPLFLLLTLLALFLSAPPAIRPLITLPFLFDPHYIAYSLGGVSDIVWAFFLIMMVAQWRNDFMRAVWFGLACAFKQQPWLLAPLLLIRLWHELYGHPLRFRLWKLVELGLISGFVFLLFNAPFMLWNFDAWLTGVLEPLKASMIIFGQGVSMLMVAGLLNIPRAAFAMFSYGIYLVSLFLYGRHGRAWREAIWLIPALMLWMGHRSLSSYWYFYALPFALDLAQNGLLSQRMTAGPRHSQHLPVFSYALVGLVMVAIVGSLLFFAVRPVNIAVEVERPIQTNNGQIDTLSLTVHNQSDKRVIPRISVQSWSDQPFFWQIVDGPEFLAPSEVGHYQIHTNTTRQSFNLRQGAQVIVTDASSYDLRGSTVIEGEFASRYYDPISNGSFEFWWTINGRLAPFAWGLMGTPADNVAYIKTDAGQPGVRLTLASGETANWATAMLDIWVPLPEDDILAWINVPADANVRPALNVVYGFEVIVTKTDQRVWILYGDEPAQGQLSANLWYWMRPAPRSIWSLQTINVRQIFDDLAIELPPPENFVRYDVVAPVTMVNFRLMGGARNQPPGPLSFDFGPVESRNLIPDPDQLTREYLAQPEIFLMWRGDYNLLARNYDRALDYYNSAVELNPDLEEAYYRIALIGLIRAEDPTAEGNVARSAETTVTPSGG